MKKDSKQTAQTISLIVNGIKSSISNFTLEELSSLLKQNQCPYWNRISTILIAHNLLIKSEKSKYNFSLERPIYYIIFEVEVKKLLKRQSKYTNKWMNKRKAPVEKVIDPFEGLNKYSIKTLFEYLNKRIQEMYLFE